MVESGLLAATQRFKVTAEWGKFGPGEPTDTRDVITDTRDVITDTHAVTHSPPLPSSIATDMPFSSSSSSFSAATHPNVLTTAAARRHQAGRTRRSRCSRRRRISSASLQWQPAPTLPPLVWPETVALRRRDTAVAAI